MKIYHYLNWTAFIQKLPKERVLTGNYYEIKLYPPKYTHPTLKYTYPSLYTETTFFTKRWGWKREIKDTVNYLMFKTITKENK